MNFIFLNIHLLPVHKAVEGRQEVLPEEMWKTPKKTDKAEG